jgi:hypothetical protein
VLRLILCLLVFRKGLMTRMEANWFVYQTRKYNLSPEQREILRSDLKTQPAVDVVFDAVQDQDLDTLQKLLSLAAKVDGKITDDEKSFLSDIHNKTKLRRLNPNEVIGSFVADHMHRQDIWSHLQDVGEALSRHVPYIRRFYW